MSAFLNFYSLKIIHLSMSLALSLREAFKILNTSARSSFHARGIMDSRGNPTVEVDVIHNVQKPGARISICVFFYSDAPTTQKGEGG